MAPQGANSRILMIRKILFIETYQFFFIWNAVYQLAAPVSQLAVSRKFSLQFLHNFNAVTLIQL